MVGDPSEKADREGLKALKDVLELDGDEAKRVVAAAKDLAQPEHFEDTTAIP